MNVLGLIASFYDPASRFRILQYEPYLREKEVSLSPKYFKPRKDLSPETWTKFVKQFTGINEWRFWNMLQNISRLPLLFYQFNYDLIWQSRMLLPYLFNLDKAIRRPIVLDIDDSIWMLESKSLTERAVSSVTEIFAGNEYLADWVKAYNKNITIIPTTIDTKSFLPAYTDSDDFTIGWIGTSPNLKYLRLIMPALEKFLSRYNDAKFILVSNCKPNFIKFDDKNIIYKPWNAESENHIINKFTVGIMPLTDDEWTRGKCSFKLLQYMACAKPIIASPVGTNKKLLQHQVGLEATTAEDWLSAFEELYHNRDVRSDMGINGRKVVENLYDTRKWSSVVADRLKSINK